MSTPLLVCLTVLTCLGASLWFLHLHLISTKTWRQELIAYLESHHQARLADHLDATAALITARTEALQQDNQALHQSMVNLAEELKLLKAGQLTRPRPFGASTLG